MILKLVLIGENFLSWCFRPENKRTAGCFGGLLTEWFSSDELGRGRLVAGIRVCHEATEGARAEFPREGVVRCSTQPDQRNFLIDAMPSCRVDTADVKGIIQNGSVVGLIK